MTGRLPIQQDGLDMDGLVGTKTEPALDECSAISQIFKGEGSHVSGIWIHLVLENMGRSSLITSPSLITKLMGFQSGPHNNPQ
jgi:hypothetical protein